MIQIIFGVCYSISGAVLFVSVVSSYKLFYWIGCEFVPFLLIPMSIALFIGGVYILCGGATW